MTNEDVTELDSYEPDWEQNCENCGQSPTVTGVKDGLIVLDVGMCGPCTWGEAAMLDPDKWND